MKCLFEGKYKFWSKYFLKTAPKPQRLNKIVKNYIAKIKTKE